MTTNHGRILALLSAILAAAALRLVPHPPNFTPIGAMALFSGAYLGRRTTVLAFAAPLAAMLLSDAILGFYSGFWITYFAVAAIVLIGSLALVRRSAIRIGFTAVAGSIAFFLISNFTPGNPFELQKIRGAMPTRPVWNTSCQWRIPRCRLQTGL